MVAPVGFEPYVAGVKGRLPYQLEEGTKICAPRLLSAIEVRGAASLLC